MHYFRSGGSSLTSFQQKHISRTAVSEITETRSEDVSWWNVSFFYTMATMQFFWDVFRPLSFLWFSIYNKFSQLLLTHFLYISSFQVPYEGAQTSIYCSVAKGIECHSGQNFHDCAVMYRYFTARDPKLPKLLWTETEKLAKTW